MLTSNVWRLADAAILAAVLVAVAIAVSASSGPPAPAAPVVSSALRGIPERDGVLGSPQAPVTVTEFVDLQCPVCAQASRQTLPGLLEKVRAGQIRLEARTLSFLGPDSVRAARVAAGAERQGRLWPFLEAFYAAQGTANSGYVTDRFLGSVAKASGVDASDALRYADGDAAQGPLDRADADAARLEIALTPSFAVTRDGEQPKVMPDTAALERELAR